MGKRDSGIDKDLLAFVSGLDASEGKQPTSKRSAKAAATGTESRAVPSLDEKVSLADLTAVLDDEMGFSGLKKRMTNVIEAEAVASGDSTERVANVEIVAAPLAPHEQTRLERQAAYELARREVSKWIPVIRANRQAKTLAFPAPVPQELSATSEAIVASAEPKTSLEQSIQRILQKSGMDGEEGIIKAEQLELNKLTPEEVERRYAELAKKRSLLFFSERKQKRHAKIKSKSYRKVVKRENERRIIKDAETSGDRLTEEELREERIKAELERIKERMTLKTRRAGKWAHDLMQKRRLEAGSREEVMQQVRDKDRLRQEILGKAAQFGAEFGSGSDVDSDNAEAEHFADEDYNAQEEEHGATILAKSSRAPGARRRREDDFDEDEDGDGDEDDKLSSFEGEELPENEVDEIFTSHQQEKAAAQAPVGRRTFAPSNPINKTEHVKDNGPATTETASSSDPLASLAGDALTVVSGLPKKAPRTTKKASSATSASALASAPTSISALFEAEGAEEGENESSLDQKTRAQLDMIKRAFAEDQVFAEFEAAKKAEVEADQPKDIDLTLPGWGAWGGEGIVPQKGKIILKSKDGVDPRKRKDAHLRHVIIHEKQAKKAATLMVAKTPFPFGSREAYERTLETPVGKEWNSTLTYTNRIEPRVRVKVGSIIEPIRFVKKDYSG